MEFPAPPSPPLPPPPPPPFGAPARPHRTLRRDRSNAVLGGVAAGMAESYGLDVALVRVLWLIAVFLQIGVPAYIICWIAIPPSSAPRRASGPPRHPETWGTLVAAVIGITLGSLLLPRMWRFDHFGAPLLLIGGGIAILLLRRRDDVLAAPATPEADASVTPEPAPSAPAEPQPTDTQTATATVPPTAWTQTAPWPAPPNPRVLRRAARHDRRARRTRPFITPVTLSILLIGGGIASLLQATGAADVNLTVVLAIGTGVVGVALVVAAFAGRAHTLIFVGLVLLAATAISNTLDVPLRGGIGSGHYQPLQRSELRSRYELGIGELKVDLREVPLANQTTTVDVRDGVGHILVMVPNSVRVEVHAHAGAGSLNLFGHEQGGWPADATQAVDGTGPGVLRLDLRAGAGNVEVRRFEPDGAETIVGSN